MTDLLEKLKLAFFPRRCGICGRVICFDEELCPECSSSLPYIEEPVCLKCGCSKKNCVCRKFSRETEYKALIAPFYYEGRVAEGILNLKMNAMPKLANRHGREIANAVRKNYKEIDFDFVTFVPMYKSDLSDRGFNQAELLAKVVSSECGIPFKEILVKKRKTKMQKRQSAKDRFVNMYGAFELKKGVNVDGARVLLIDDVKTTGSTLTSVSLTLKAYGAKEVYCAVTAVVKLKDGVQKDGKLDNGAEDDKDDK